MPKFRCLASETQYVPEVRKNVDPDELVEVPGEVAAELGDAVIVAGPQGERAWPAAGWSLVADIKPKGKE